MFSGLNAVRLLLLAVYLCLQSAYTVFSIEAQQFYPFGASTQRVLPAVSGISDPIALQATYSYYGQEYTRLRVHLGGVISLGSDPGPLVRHRKSPFPPNLPIIAPWYAPAVISPASQLSYGETRDAGVLARATRDVRSVFIDEQSFSASAVFVVTWYRVQHAHHTEDGKNNTFQAVLISDGQSTFVLYNYATDGLQWSKGYHVRWRNTRTYHAQAGFSAGDNIRLYTLPGSGTTRVHHLATSSNINSAGQWMYRVGWSDMNHLGIQSADSYEEEVPTDFFFVEQYYKGCYQVHGYLSMMNGSQIWTDISIRSCMILCYERDAGYIALHGGNQCACMWSMQHLAQAQHDDKCSMRCTVNDDEICGGRDVMSVYETTAHASVMSDESARAPQRNDLNECTTGNAQCHVNATCINKSPGFCCECDKGFYGNGIACLKKGAVQRMIGYMSGSVNGQPINNLFMDTIGFSNDGRAYVATRGLPPGLAHSMRILTPLTDVVGWMFGLPKTAGQPNGYSIVGTRFTRNATVMFDSGEAVSIYQKFQGKDYSSQHVRVETIVRGSVPIVPPGAKVVMPKFQEEYARTGRGRIQSRGRVKYQVNGVENQFLAEQTIEYDEPRNCAPDMTSVVLEADLLMTRYDESQSFMGIAIRGRVRNGTSDDAEDVQKQQGKEKPELCGRVTCHRLGVCITYRGRQECRCNYGYRGDGVTYCRDADECQLNRYRCDPNAECINTVGSYRCKCKTGYAGDGKSCREALDFQCPQPCDRNARCVRLAVGGKICVCLPGYQGNGFQCKPDGTCEGVTCDANARCLRAADNSRRCVCNAGFVGDGRKCTEVGSCGGVKCSGTAQCVQSKCACNAGYQGDGQRCSDADECELKTHRCDMNADCTNTVGSYRCRCRPGYTGDGFRCTKVTTDTGCNGKICHANAQCFSYRGQKQCVCERGYQGNGVQCKDINECEQNHECDALKAVCTNTEGSYSCTCRPGYGGDGRTCTPISPCGGEVCHRFGKCVTDPSTGRKQCRCRVGFRGNGVDCDDMNECIPLLRTCDANALCRNTLGSYECLCRRGFVKKNGRCVSDGTCNGGTCSVDARCDAILGCVCKSGFQGDGVNCTDIDECEPGRNRCDPNAECRNTVGSFQCACKTGFVGDGFRCTSDGSCGGTGCDANARCDVRADGVSRQCVCNSGWQGNGLSCVDVNECSSAQCPVNADCINTVGSYLCRCRLGFSKNGSICQGDSTCGGVECGRHAQCVQHANGNRECVCNAGWVQDAGRTCVDVDECRTLPKACHRDADCTNTPGSYSCRCRPGFAGDGQICDADGTCAGATCHPDAVCHRNTAHGTRCVCKAGYLGDGRKCTDIDECVKGEHNCSDRAVCTNTEGSFSCKCILGYVGNGNVCATDGTCLGVKCDPNARCSATSPSGENRTCVCNDGFSGDGTFCRDLDECALGHANCHRKAKCVNQIGSFVCRCILGYVGDGKDCKSDGTCEGKVCDYNGECVAKNTSEGTGRDCHCKDGFEGDGIICTDKDECLDGPCHKNSICINNFGSYLCLCNPGYKKNSNNGKCERLCRRCLNGGSCRSETKCACPKGFTGSRCQWYGDASLIFTKGNSVQRMSLPPRPSAIGLLYQSEGMVNVGLDYDCVDEYVYWSEIMQGCIMRAKYDGSSREIVIPRSQVRNPEGVAVDWMGRNLYWTDTGLDVIEVSRLNGSNRRVLISNGLDDPRAILVDPPNGKMYWSDWTRRRPRIEVANMDGSERRVLIYDDLGLPNGLTLVQATNELCYTDAGTWSIRCVDLGALNVRKVLYPVPYPFGIASFNRTLYWTDWMNNKVQRIGVDAKDPDTPLRTYVGRNGKIFDVKAIQPCPARAPANPCAVDNGGCMGLCMLKPGGYTCSCPKGMFPINGSNGTKCRGKCNDPLGVEQGLIADSQMTSSSAWNNNYKRYGAHRARLNLATWPAGWNAKKFDPAPWLQIDLGSEKTVTGVATQGLGHSNYEEWVKTYKVSLSSDGDKWFVYQDGSSDKVFLGNSDRSSIKRNELKPPLKTRWLRIRPRTWTNNVALRIELYGC